MKKQALRYLIGSQVLYLVTLLVCFSIKPEVLLDNRAISLYGSETGTAVPYVIGFLGAAYLILRAALLLPKFVSVNRTLSRWLIVLSGLLAGLTITPYTINSALFYLHATFAFLLFVVELGLGFWLVIKARKDGIDTVLFLAQATGFVISLLSLGEIKVLHLLVVGQLIAIGMFALLLTRAVHRIEEIQE